MEQTIIRKRWSVVSAEQLARASVFLFFCKSALTALVSKILPIVNLGSMSDTVTAIIVYTPLVMACLLQPKRFIKADFLILLALVCAFFGLTLLFHPEYEYWYKRSDYGVWNYVLFPLNGLYTYLFIRIEDEPQKLKRDFKTAGYVMYLYFFYQIFAATRRGYWIGITGLNSTAEFSYSVTFGYNVLYFCLVFLYDAFSQKKATDIFMSIIGLVMIVTNGSRGPALFVALFVLLYYIRTLKSKRNSRRKTIVFVLMVLALILVYTFYRYLYSLLISLLGKLNINSRVLQKLLAGTLTSDSGRSVIWNAAIQMIRENPFGYGAMGSQHVISNYIYVGYPHSIVLEMMIDYGAVIGGALFLFLLWRSIRVILDTRCDWIDLFLPMFSTGCALFISLCYWSNKAFWGCIAIVVNYGISRKKAMQAASIEQVIQDE